MQLAGDQSTTSQRLTVQEAAILLDITVDAVRGRIKRSSLRSEKGEDGTVYVLVDEATSDGLAGDQTDDQHELSGDQSQLVEHMAEQIDYLGRQLEVWQEEARREDHIIAALTERIPELEPVDTPPDARQTPGEGPKGV
jgi:hypothetical protein